MKGSKRFPVLAAFCILGVTLMTAACVKNSPAASDDLQFSAESSISTKAIYGADAGEYQRIIWQGGDEVTIASALGTAFTSAVADIMTAIQTVLPIVLPVVGAIAVIGIDKRKQRPDQPETHHCGQDRRQRSALE